MEIQQNSNSDSALDISKIISKENEKVGYQYLVEERIVVIIIYVWRCGF